MTCAFGVDLGGTTVKLAFFKMPGELLEKWEIPTDTSDGGSKILPDIAASVQQYLDSRGIDKNSVIGIGIGVPGAVSNAGVVNQCVNLGWDVVPVEQILGELTGLPVKAGNDANVAALGESWTGGGKGCDNMLMVTLGTGVGGGIIVGGRILNGAHGAGGEIGHIVLNRDETELCGCGKRGCAEQYCSATGIVRTCKQYLAATDAPSALRDIAQLTCRDIFDAAKAGDTVAQDFLETVYDLMAEFLANVCNVVDPEIVVIGGGVSKAGQVLLDGICRYLKKHIFHAASSVRFALAELGNDAGVWGAYKLVLDYFAK